jgi:hypothetical protein
MTIRRDINDLLSAQLAAAATVKAAAAELGIGEKTAHRRLADPAFRDHVAPLRREMTGRAIGQLAEGMAQAAEQLRRLTESPNEGVRLKACVVLLDLGLKAAVTADLEDRIRRPEERLHHPSATQSLGQDRSQGG